MMRNIIRFATTPPRDIELIAEGTIWPSEIVVDDEAWLMGEVVEAGSGFTIREYVQTERLSPGQRLLRAIQGGR